MRHVVGFFIILITSLLPGAAVAEPTGTKGQNYDRVVIELATDAEVRIQAKVMTINRFVDSASTISVTDNGAQVIAPVPNTTERWSQTFAVAGKGPHEILMICKSQNSSPVYCSLNVENAAAAVVR